MTQEWTPERAAALITWWNEGICASEIGRRLSVTKNAAIGKAFRLQLPKRRPPSPSQPDDQSIIRLERLGAGMCSWPLGATDETGFHFCGSAAVPGKPYCPTHCKLGYLPAAKTARLLRSPDLGRERKPHSSDIARLKFLSRNRGTPRHP